MVKRTKTKMKVISLLFLIVALLIGNKVFASINTRASSGEKFDLSPYDLIDHLKLGTSSTSSLFNQREGVFLWNVRNPIDLSRFGDLGDQTNGQEELSNMNFNTWLEGLAQDVAIQYLLLKNNVFTSLMNLNSFEEQRVFYRDWIFTTEKVINWLYHNIAINDELIDLLNLVSEEKNGFTEFWNTLIRPKENSFLDERISLLPDTLELAAQILKATEFMPYFTQTEKSSLVLMAEMISEWWYSINKYCIYDPAFAIAGIGNPRITAEQGDSWISWSNFIYRAKNDLFPMANITNRDYKEFTNYLYISPQIANYYIVSIEKVAVKKPYLWDENVIDKVLITNPLAQEIHQEILTSYASHISYVEDMPQYIYDPTYDQSWFQLNEKYSGYSYYWPEYLIDQQDSEMDLYQYQSSASPLKTTGFRTFQGAGDIRGLMDIYRLLRHGFSVDFTIQDIEKAAFNIINEVLRAQRSTDNGYIISPYFGSAISEAVFPEALINDADVKYPTLLPEGLNVFIGSMTVAEFLFQAKDDLDKVSLNLDGLLITNVFNTLIELGELFLDNIYRGTMGIPKQSIVGYNSTHLEKKLYGINHINIAVRLGSKFSENNLPSWIHSYNPLTNIGYTKAYQWDYMPLLQQLFRLTANIDYFIPLYHSLEIFIEDYLEDGQYQIPAICEAKDAVARALFKEIYSDNQITLSDPTGLYGNIIPYDYRSMVSPVTNAFALETPQQISALLLQSLPFLPKIEEILSNPINQVVIIGFVTGIIMTVAIMYVKRPKNQ